MISLLPNCSQNINFFESHFILPKKHHSTCNMKIFTADLHVTTLILSLGDKQMLFGHKFNFRENRLTHYSKIQRFDWGTSSLIQFVCKMTHTASCLSWDFSCKTIEFAHSCFWEKNSPRSVLLIAQWNRRKMKQINFKPKETSL